MSSRTINRKRSRAQLDEEDELASGLTTTPLSTAKRKKVNLPSPSPAKRTYIGSIKKSLSGFLGFRGQGVENEDSVDDDGGVEDELMSTPKEKKPEKDIYDVPSSPEDKKLTPARTVTKAASSGRKTSIKEKSTGSVRRTVKTQNSTSKDMYEIPDDEPNQGKGTKTGNGGLSVDSFDVRKNDVVLPKRKPGRPRKSDILKQEKQLSNKAQREKMMAEKEDEYDEEDAQTPSKNNSRKDTASVLRADNISPAKRKESLLRDGVHITSPYKELKSALTPSKGRRGGARKSVAFDDIDEVDLGFKDIPDSVSAKKAAKKITVPTPKKSYSSNNLTPSKSESVDELAPVEDDKVDEEGEVEADDDVACTACSELHSEYENPMLLCDKCDSGLHLKCSKLDKAPKGAWFCSNCVSKHTDTEICVVCRSAKQTKKNPIVLCETCDNGIHLDCSDWTEVPKDEWYCQECDPKQINSSLKSAPSAAMLSGTYPDIEGFETHINCMQRVLLDKLTGQKRIKLVGHDDEMAKVYQVVEQTVKAGEGNSMLVIGARGCGKTTLIETVISELSPNHRDNFHVVRLNGFIHTDDKLALKEIWRQLGREMEVEDDAKSNYADTLASLLALLSHPGELSESDSEQTAKSVVFILDEFDLFTTHSRQTLLYNLFDIAQARKAPIVVLGLTTRIDVVESLEKRVKSRFSHRYVHLSLPRSLPAFWEICKAGLTASAEELASVDDSKTPGRDEFLSYWDSMIDDLYKNDPPFKSHLQSLFYLTKSIPSFFTTCLLPLTSLSPALFPLTGHSFATLPSLAPPDSKLTLLPSLSTLELALLISAARLDIIQDTDVCNFAMAYDEYSTLTSRHKILTSSSGIAALGSSAKVWGREVALGAWERLGDAGLLVPAGVGGGVREFGAGGRMWKVDVGLEEIAGSVEGLSGVMGKWCREI